MSPNKSFSGATFLGRHFQRRLKSYWKMCKFLRRRSTIDRGKLNFPRQYEDVHRCEFNCLCNLCLCLSVNCTGTPTWDGCVGTVKTVYKVYYLIVILSFDFHHNLVNLGFKKRIDCICYALYTLQDTGINHLSCVWFSTPRTPHINDNTVHPGCKVLNFVQCGPNKRDELISDQYY